MPGGAASRFDAQESVLYGGVLFLLPALIQQGLFKASEVYTGVKEGFYRVESIVLTLAIMALCLPIAIGIRTPNRPSNASRVNWVRL